MDVGFPLLALLFAVRRAKRTETNGNRISPAVVSFELPLITEGLASQPFPMQTKCEAKEGSKGQIRGRIPLFYEKRVDAIAG
jgi:hypothetical protein